MLEYGRLVWNRNMCNAVVENIDLQVLLVYYDSAPELSVFGSLTS